MREELPFPDKVLQTLHNLCATAADLARRGEEVARILQHDQSEIENILGFSYGNELVHHDNLVVV